MTSRNTAWNAREETRSVPVVLFVYARPFHLRQTLASLRNQGIATLYVYSDGPASPSNHADVAAVREIVRQIDWCEVICTERAVNLGLGRNLLTGVAETFARTPMALFVEDDLVVTPGACGFLSAALRHYHEDDRVMSVTGWTHPRVTPAGIGKRPYFDGRAECLLWGSWARAWRGMEEDALAMLRECRSLGIHPATYGADLPRMARQEEKKNIWAVRFLFHHMRRRGLCLRPPWSLVRHIGFDGDATNASDPLGWEDDPPPYTPAVPEQWPAPVENGECSLLWRRVMGGRPFRDMLIGQPERAVLKVRRALRRVLRMVRASR